MNKCYRLVFNRFSGVWQAVAEHASGHGSVGSKLVATAVLAAVMPIAHAQATDPKGLTDLGEITLNAGSNASAVSADGTTVVGTSGSDAMYWTQGGMTAMDLSAAQNPNLTGTFASARAYGVNGDGSVIVGQLIPSSGSNGQAFRWTASGGFENLGTLETTPASNSFSSAYAVNGDGTVVVGEALTNASQTHAFRWDAVNGMTQLFTNVVEAGASITAGSSSANAVNKAGNVMAGSYNNGSETLAFRYSTSGSEAQSLGVLDAATNSNWWSNAMGINAAGDVVVGASSNGNGNREAFRWTAAGMVGLGAVSGFTDSYAAATNSTGNVVVGHVYSQTNSGQGFRWESGAGMQTVEQWLAASGVDTSALTSTTLNATGVSADGSIVVGTLSNGNAYLARGTAGLIDTAAFSTSLARTAASALLAENQNDLVLHGMHGNPIQTLLKTGGSAFWTAGDFGRQDRDARQSNIAAGEIGFAHRLNDAVQFNIAAGHTYSQANTQDGGKTRVTGNFVVPEAIVSLPGRAYATISGIYARGAAKIDRGYLNTGAQTYSYGSPDTSTLGARIRFDWHEAASLGGVALTPFAGLSYLRTKIDGYTEKGGGFPVRWNQREEKATSVRAGVDLAKPINSVLKMTGRVEGVHRLESKNAGASGQILGLGEFNFAGQNLKQNWLRFGIGLEGKLGSGIASATINTTTGGESAAYWLAASYRLPF